MDPFWGVTTAHDFNLAGKARTFGEHERRREHVDTQFDTVYCV